MAEKAKKRLLIVFPKAKPKPAPSPAPAKAAKQSGDQFMLKALEAHQAGRLSVLELGIAENCITKGLEIPEQIEGRVYG